MLKSSQQKLKMTRNFYRLSHKSCLALSCCSSSIPNQKSFLFRTFLLLNFSAIFSAAKMLLQWDLYCFLSLSDFTLFCCFLSYRQTRTTRHPRPSRKEWISGKLDRFERKIIFLTQGKPAMVAEWFEQQLCNLQRQRSCSDPGLDPARDYKIDRSKL